jgi:hypothetical protein
VSWVNYDALWVLIAIFGYLTGFEAREARLDTAMLYVPEEVGV